MISIEHWGLMLKRYFPYIYIYIYILTLIQQEAATVVAAKIHVRHSTWHHKNGCWNMLFFVFFNVISSFTLFSRGISLKVSVMVRVEFEFAYYDITIQNVSLLPEARWGGLNSRYKNKYLWREREKESVREREREREWDGERKRAVGGMERKELSDC